MRLEILGVVIVRQLLAFFDCALGEYVDAAILDINLTIRRARVIDESSSVTRNVAIYHRLRARPKKVFAGVFLNLLLRRGATSVFDDARASRNILAGKHPAPRARALYDELESDRCKSVGFHDGLDTLPCSNL